MKLCKGAILALAVSYGLTYCHTTKSKLTLEQKSDSLTVIHITNPTNYILLPIEEEAAESQVLLDTGEATDTDMDIRLAQTQVDYFVPFALPTGVKTATVCVRNKSKDALCWKEIKLSDTFDTANTEKFRPVYHHTPLYGWMNDANGLVYKDGEYHLYFQYNPYGSKWGNMHWGHSVSKDLVHWEHLAPAIARDTLGHIFSGSSIVDQENVAGYGAGNILAFYTSASDKNGQIQCLAFSKDNGRTFTKYEKNPILCPADGLRDFRDPKVFRYEPEDKWVMIVSADKEMRFYDSKNLKDWNYMSSFGEGYGVQPCQFECPDMVELPVDGDLNRKKWALIVNVNPGCYFGGSATQYFTGNFDGTKFSCDSQPNVTKWLDWGKDHYATVCFSNTGERTIAVPWMSNWQYAGVVPSMTWRGGMTLPRELALQKDADGRPIITSRIVKEVDAIAGEWKTISASDNTYAIDNNEDAYELQINMDIADNENLTLTLSNEKGDKYPISLNRADKSFIIDRTQSGEVSFSSEFGKVLYSPLNLSSNAVSLTLFVDKSSVEALINDGMVQQTNLVYPSEIYNSLSVESGKGQIIKSVKVRTLSSVW